ncbi:MAG: TVP38/TMEM64 family protein, partial [Planctomycetes bacterium]|nr:TVP38/TMEM64 family protein [Planctomycetota bacterium]
MPSDPDRIARHSQPDEPAGGGSSRAFAAAAWLVLASCIGLSLWSWLSGGLVSDLASGEHDAAWKLERLKDAFESCGPFAPLAYFLFVMVEVVVAPIPGLMLYAPGGIIFGGFLGGLIALLGNVFGAGIACQVTRSLGGNWLTRLLSPKALEATQNALARRGGWLVFLLRINPLTSSDLVSYAAGFTQIPVWKVMLATLAGMAPLCFA